MKDLGPAYYFLGVALTSHDNHLFLSQRKYALEILNHAGFISSKPALTPVDTKPKLGLTSSPLLSDPTLYRSLVGALQYLIFTHPDIVYVSANMHVYA